MRKKEADRLREIANQLEDYVYDIYWRDHRKSYVTLWGITEIRKVIMDSGFNAIIEGKYIKPNTLNWELKNEEEEL